MNLLKTISTETLKVQVGYNRYLAKSFGRDAGDLQVKCYSNNNIPTEEQAQELKKFEYMSNYYWIQAKIIITELKKRRTKQVAV